VLLASHQLKGHVVNLWDAYVEAHVELENINWQDFKAAFHSHHEPQGIIKMKKKEFHDLTHGSMLVNMYVTHCFTQLSHYAPNEVDKDEKKQKCGILTQGLIGLIEYSYHQGIPSFLEAQLKRTLGLSMLGSEQFQDG
jgi:hypothetical protein